MSKDRPYELKDLTKEEAMEVMDNSELITDLAFRLAKFSNENTVKILSLALAQACAFTGIPVNSLSEDLTSIEEEFINSLQDESVN